MEQERADEAQTEQEEKMEGKAKAETEITLHQCRKSHPYRATNVFNFTVQGTLTLTLNITNTSAPNGSHNHQS